MELFSRLITSIKFQTFPATKHRLSSQLSPSCLLQKLFYQKISSKYKHRPSEKYKKKGKKRGSTVVKPFSAGILEGKKYKRANSSPTEKLLTTRFLYQTSNDLFIVALHHSFISIAEIFKGKNNLRTHHFAIYKSCWGKCDTDTKSQSIFQTGVFSASLL